MPYEALAHPSEFDTLSEALIAQVPSPQDWTHLADGEIPWDKRTQQRLVAPKSLLEFPALADVFKYIAGRWHVSPSRVHAYISLSASHATPKRGGHHS